MDDDLSLIIVGTCMRAARDIGDLARLVPGDRKDLKIGIASAIHEIQENLIDVILDESPQIKLDMERRMEKFDRMI